MVEADKNIWYPKVITVKFKDGSVHEIQPLGMEDALEFMDVAVGGNGPSEAFAFSKPLQTQDMADEEYEKVVAMWSKFKEQYIERLHKTYKILFPDQDPKYVGRQLTYAMMQIIISEVLEMNKIQVEPSEDGSEVGK